MYSLKIDVYFISFSLGNKMQWVMVNAIKCEALLKDLHKMKNYL